MKTFHFGDIVLLIFPHSDGVYVSKRPALILSDTGNGDVIVCRITSQIRNSKFDIGVANSPGNGLLLPSVIRVHKIATIEKRRIDRIIGKIEKSLIERILKTFQLLLESDI